MSSALDTTTLRKVYEAYDALDETVCGEVIDGVLETAARPIRGHGYFSSVAGAQLLVSRMGPPGRPPQWIIIDEPELFLGPHIVTPDLGGWREERYPKGEGRGYRVAPDWGCEVLSPSTARRDRGRKMRIYRDSGVGHLWLADPATKFLEVYRLTDIGYAQVQVVEGDVTARIEPFEDTEFDVSRWWPQTGEPGVSGDEGAS